MQDTPLRYPPSELGANGNVPIAQVEPVHRTPHGLRTTPSPSLSPTTQHSLLETHEIPNAGASTLAPQGMVAVVDQAVPFHMSANGRLSPSLFLEYPAAMHQVVDTQLTPVKIGFAPGVGGCVTTCQ